MTGISDLFRMRRVPPWLRWIGEVKKFDVEVEALLSSIYGESDGVEWLKVKLLDKADNRSSLEVLQLVGFLLWRTNRSS